MQELLKRMLAELHAAYLKPNGFTKDRQRFRRAMDDVVQEVEFQSSQWNSSGGPIRFYVNISVSFTDIPMKTANQMAGAGRISGLVSEIPPEFDLTASNYEIIKGQLLSCFPTALSELPKYYEDVRQRAKTGLFTPIPLPESWRA